MNIRRARPEEAAALTAIAHDAKRYWGYPEHWIQHWEEDLTISPELISNQNVFVAESDNQLLGFYALVVNEKKADLDHMWVAPSQIGKGVGKELFLHAMKTADELKISQVLITADPNAEGFYEKMGASRIGATDSEIDGRARSLPRMKVNTRSG
jgi:N-acetylglutamate synthase-like GNAT family acetyltransferase